LLVLRVATKTRLVHQTTRRGQREELISRLISGEFKCEIIKGGIVFSPARETTGSPTANQTWRKVKYFKRILHIKGRQIRAK
jgi:hypothetical protein